MSWLAILAWANKHKAAILIAFIAIGLYGLGHHNGKQSQAAKTAKVQAEFDAYKKEVQKAVSIRLTQNKLKEAEDRQVFAEIAKQYKKDIANAKAKADRITADLRAGNIKLRKHWEGCRSASKGSGNTAGIDEGAELRATGAGDIIRITAEADAQVKGLQKGWLQCEKREAVTQ